MIAANVVVEKRAVSKADAAAIDRSKSAYCPDVLSRHQSYTVLSRRRVARSAVPKVYDLACMTYKDERRRHRQSSEYRYSDSGLKP